MAAMFSKDEIFQLTPSRRATEQLLAENEQLIISTHALTEGDPLYQDSDENYQAFQLTPSRRATKAISNAGILGSHFNSRPHGGRPKIFASLLEIFGVTFQLTPSRRATIIVCFSDSDKPLFQLTPSRRATVVAGVEGDKNVFQLTPSRRATLPLLLFRPTPGYFNSRPHGGRPGPSLTYPFVVMIFQLTPSRRATCKFRQIFLLNRGYAYSISLYFLPHFISLLPQILSFQQKPFKFQVRIFLLFSVHLAFALQNQCVHHVKSRFCTNMFYFVFVLFTQIVKSQTISLFIYDFF